MDLPHSIGMERRSWDLKRLVVFLVFIRGLDTRRLGGQALSQRRKWRNYGDDESSSKHGDACTTYWLCDDDEVVEYYQMTLQRRRWLMPKM